MIPEIESCFFSFTSVDIIILGCKLFEKGRMKETERERRVGERIER